MSPRPPLTFAGGDVVLASRLADGRVRVAFVDRAGQPTGHRAEVWPHELRGLGWHLAEIKRLIQALPMAAPAGGSVGHPTREPAPFPLQKPAPTPRRGWLFAHHVAAAEEREN